MNLKPVGTRDVPLRLLFIDDDPLDREWVRRLLVGRGVQLVEATSGAAARERADASAPDCVLLDNGLPDMDGLDLLVFFQERQIPVVLLTGRGSQRLAARAILGGAADYLQKDTLTGPTLLKSVEGAMQKRDMLRLIARQQEMLRAREALLSQLIEALPVGVCIIDPGGTITLANRAAGALLCPDSVGRRFEEVMASQVYWRPDERSRFPPEDMPALRALKDRRPHVAEFERRGADRVLTIGSSAVPILEPDGALRCVVVANQDITPFKELERQAHRARRAEMISRLAGGVAHDFNNLSAVIELNATMALDVVGADSPAREDLLGILDATREAGELTRRLVSFSKAAPQDPEDIPASPGIPAPPRPAPARAGGPRVLVAEDEPGIRKQLGRLLPRLGFQVESAPDGASALAAFEAAPDSFDLVLTDIVMPGMQGPDLARQLRARRPSLPVIFMTGYADIEAAALSGPLLRKPFSVPDLEEALRAAAGISAEVS